MADDDSGINARLAVELSADLTQLRKSFQEAGKAAEGALLGIEQRGERTKRRMQENLAMIRLTQQLDVARASGNNKVVDKLSEEILLRKTVNGLISQGIKAEEARAMAQAHVNALAAAKKSNEGIEGAGKSIFGSTRLATLEEGGARLGIYGGALEKLGPAGFAAAAGLAAAGVALEEAHKAMEWGEDTEKTAKALGETTTRLQQMDFAAIKAGVSAETVHEGLLKIGQAVGSFTSNVRDGRINPIFDALNKAAGGGFTKADVSQWQGPTDAMEHIADGLAKIKDRSQQLNLIRALRVPDEMVPLLLQGGDALRTAAKEAKDLGVVMDESTVKKAAELNEKVKEANSIIGNQLRTAFVNLAPAVLAIVTMMAKLASLAADFADNIAHGNQLDPSKTDYGQYNQHHLQEISTNNQNTMDRVRATAKQEGYSTDFQSNGDIHIPQSKTLENQFNSARAEFQKATSALAIKVKADSDVSTHIPATAIVADKVPKVKKPKAETDDTGLVTGADAALDEAKHGLAEAIAKQSTDLQTKADAEKAGNFDTLQKQTDDLVRKELEIDKAIASTKDRKKQAVLRAAEATLEEAAVTDGLARAAKDELVEREKLVGLIQQAAAAAAQDAQMRQEGFQREQAYYTAVAGLSNIADERREFERKALDAAQARERDEAQAKVDAAMSAYGVAKTNNDVPGMLSGIKSVSSAVTAQAALPAMQGLQNQAFDNSHLSPWGAWVKEGQDSAADVSTTLQTYAVKSMNSFNESIAKSIADGKNMGQIFANIFKQMETDLISYLLKQAEIGVFGGGPTNSSGAGGGNILGTVASMIFGSAIPKFAGGTDDAPGGVADVGEHGPERIMLPKGSKVVPNNVLSGLNSSATRAMSVSSTTYVAGPAFHLHNPVVTEDLIAQTQAYTNEMSAHAAGAGAMAGHQKTMDTLRDQRRYSLSRR